jgi:CheY-like chemotaxis protein
MNLDLVQHKTAPISSEEVSKQKIDLKGTSILLAEDNEINIKVISKMLTRFNADFTVTKNGKEAVEAFKAQPVDLILMDLQMPEIDGYEASQHILEHSDQQPYIIALTANSTQEDRNKCSQVGMKGFVSKPVTLSSLKDGLSDFLKHQNSASRN